MKVLFLEQFSELGGGQRCLLDYLPGVIARGWRATVAAPGDGPLFEQARALGAHTVRIGIGEHYSVGRKNPKDAARFVLDTIALGRWILRQDFDLLVAGGARLMPAAARGARGRPVIFYAEHYLGKSYAVAMTNRAIRRSKAAIIANSQHVAQQFENAHVVYNGVAEIPFTERTHPITNIGIIGRIAPMKGQTDFLCAAALLAPQIPSARFVICGAPMFSAQSYVDRVHRLAENLPVDFLGWRDDVGAVLKDLDLLVVPSTAAEATTRVILEAFSAGVPVVAYAIGGIPEMIRDGENGFLVPEFTPQALAQQIYKISTTDLQAIVQRARSDFEQRYTLERYQQEMTEIMLATGSTTARPPAK
jgi:glycosyltransferase involved in cell wall biosynthesis